MTCAGFLVLANHSPAFVEICTGVLVCQYDAEAPGNPQDGALPPLEPRRMAKLEVCTRTSTHKPEQHSAKTQQPEHELEPQNVQAQPRQRLMQLSGYLIEVLDKEDELDEPSLPWSFQVNTFKLTLRPDGSSSSQLHDSLILSATDEKAQKIWVKNIKFWNRYGWRDTEFVAAERSDLMKLQQMLQRDNRADLMRYSSDETYFRSQNSVVMNGGRSSFAGHSSCATRHQSRRRFYRTAIPESFAPPS